MTREEAIEVLQEKIDNRPLFKDEREAFELAIEALSADVVHKPDYSYEADMVRRLKETLLSAEAVQGEWIDAKMDYGECSECGFFGLITDFCPNCGADMRGGDTE